jgi:flagellar biosynthesis protein FliQ
VRPKLAAGVAAKTFMNPEFAVQLMKTMIWQAVILAAPFLGVAMLLGLIVSLFQAVTSINEHTLSFVPKALCVLGLLLLLAPWMVRQLVEFTAAILLKIPEMAL